MDDSQSPPDGENRADDRKGDAGRRTGLRLGNAEQVAANRRDMFGDGSLLDALSGRPLPRQDEDEPGLAADAVPAEPVGPQPADAEDAPPLTDGPTTPDAALPVARAVEPEAAESLDAIIDSFSAAPPSTADSEQLQVSAIFAGLGSPPPQGDDNGQQEQPQGDASLPEDDETAGEDAQHAAAPRRQVTLPPGLRVPLFFEPLAAAPEPSNWPPATAAGDAPASEAGEPLEPSDPADGSPQAADTAADGQPAAFEPARDGGEPFPEPLGWPPFLDPPGAQAANADAPPLEPPALVRGVFEPAADTSTSPFPGPPAWPPFPGPPGSEAGLSGPEPARLPPYIELPADPGGDEEPAAPPAPVAFTEPPPPAAFTEASPFEPPPFPTPRGMPAFADWPAATARPEQQEPPRFHDIEASPPGLGAAARVQATAKIAAEANATAQALDNLQRLLNKTVASTAAQPQPAYPQAQPHRAHHAPFHLPQDDPFANEMAMLPLPLPPSERTVGKNVYLLGFLTGLVLSVMAGLALYFLINTG